MQMLNQGLALPLDQAFVTPAHALSLTSGQQQDRAGWQGGTNIHQRLTGQSKGVL
ncbi:hypothetical protein PSCICN_49400 [Pseudomonas cichorii]|nr:hypothetical protein PSCICN_49400 [Pseudomonas cichorii]